MRRIRDIARSRAAKMRWLDPNYRAKARESAKARWADPAMREKMITGMKVTARHRKNKALDYREKQARSALALPVQWRFE